MADRAWRFAIRRDPLRTHRIHRCGAALAHGVAAGLLLLGAPDAAFAAAPSGSEFQVNSYTTGDQAAPAIASDSAGNFVVVWQSNGSAGGDTASWSVQAQRRDPSGAPIGAQFQVNTYTTNGQYAPSVASDSAGNFVVVWESMGSAGSDTSGTSVQAQRYNASGAPIGGQFQVNTYTTGYQGYASVASDSAGNFVVVWQSDGSAGSDSSASSVQGQRYAASGTPIGGEFQVNTYTTSIQSLPSVASDPAGHFVVVWQSDGSADSDVSAYSVQAQRYDASGAPLGGQFQVDSYTTNDQSYPSVATDAAGNFVVVWESDGSAYGDTSNRSVQGRRFDASGAPSGGQFQINTYTTGAQINPRVTSDSAGDFVVVWQSLGSAGSDTSSWSVQGRAYMASGTPSGGQFQVNTSTVDSQVYPMAASNTSGARFAVVWGSQQSAGSDSSGFSVQGQRYVPEPAFGQSFGAMIAALVALGRLRRSR